MQDTTETPQAPETTEQSKEVLTDVTSIADQEAKTGQSIPIPTAEELVNRATSSFIRNKRLFNMIFDRLSARGKNRVMNAVLDIPMNVDKVPVLLKDKDEKLAFAAGQQLINDRFVITQFHIFEERKRILAEKAKESQENADKSTVTSEGATNEQQ